MPKRPDASPRRARLPAALIAAGLVSAGAPAAAQTWHVEPSISIDETLTSNVNLQPSGSAKGDLVSVVTPRLSIDAKGAHTSLRGFVAAPAAIYVNTGAENNKIYPSVQLLGNVQAWEKFFQIEGEVTVTQQFFSPFGAQPTSIAYATGNRYTSALYRVSPFIQGTAPGDIKYLLRNNDTWSNLNGAPISAANSFTNEWIANVEGPVRTFGWALDGNWTEVKFSGQRPQISELARAKLIYQYDPQLRTWVDGGYEDNRFPFVRYQGAIYGLGAEWTPTERMKVVASWEHRYFGSSYLVSFENRTPLTAVSASASRHVTSYPQQLLTIPATGNVLAALFQIFASRIPNPFERLDFVEKFISDRGLPSSLSSPVPVYNQQISLQEQASASYGLLGARNSVFLSGYWLRQEPITGSGSTIPGEFISNNNNTQSGAALSWSHMLTPQVSMISSIGVSRTLANQPLRGIDPPYRPQTDQGTAQLTVTAPLSPRTTVYAGARYQKSRGTAVPGTNVAPGSYEEYAALAGFNYTFR
jgi:uncharacterized protein (PEP-CTERM system associated)